jgi:L-ascorbate metabolism protein UlaG (beta-lactamase superfamily)
VIRPFQQDDALLSDIAEAERDGDGGALHLWWLGQSGFLVSHGGVRVLFDPYLSDSLTTKYAGTDKPHVRMTERVIAPERLTGLSLVTSTHNHTDHLDAETLLPLFAVNPDARLALPGVNVPFAADRLGWSESDPRLLPLAVGERARVGTLELLGVPAAHENLAPEFMGFVLKIGPWTLYHSGDTILFDGMEAALAAHSIDVALLPINGRKPERRVSGNLWGDEAARLAKGIGAKLVVPCHYEMFEFNTEPPDLFERTCEKLHQPFQTLRAGERLTPSSGTIGTS